MATISFATPGTVYIFLLAVLHTAGPESLEPRTSARDLSTHLAQNGTLEY